MAIGLFWSSICLSVFVSLFLIGRMGGFSSKNEFPVDGRVGLRELLARNNSLIPIIDNSYHRRLPGPGTQCRASPFFQRSQCSNRREGRRKAQGDSGVHFCRRTVPARIENLF